MSLGLSDLGKCGVNYGNRWPVQAGLATIIISHLAQCACKLLAGLLEFHWFIGTKSKCLYGGRGTA